MNEVNIRTAVFNDIPMLVDFAWRSFYDTWNYMNTDEDLAMYRSQYFSDEIFTNEFQDHNISYYLAFENEMLVGYCKLRRNYAEGDLIYNRCIELQRMYVSHQTLRNGIGSLLMNHVIDIAFKENFEVMWLGVFEKNYRALAFYQKFGFEKYGSHDFVLGNDVTTDLLMMKPLL